MKLKETIMIAIAALAFMLITGIAKANPVLNWFEAEKQKTIEYQKKSWANTKEDFSNLVKKFGLLGKKKDVTQD
tara:strand:+ start:179 stop:400 length:222 start_codon:yes stop_codon:yes gene_type:complete